MTHTQHERDQDDAEAQIRAAVMNKLSELMFRANLPPMAALRLAARSIGTIYREMADEHSAIDPCPCGWRPQPSVDVELLGMALMTACRRPPHLDLRRMQVVGTA